MMLATHDSADASFKARFGKTLGLLRDMQEQDTEMIVLRNSGDPQVLPGTATHKVEIEPTRASFLPLCEVVPLQLSLYHMAVARGSDVDRLRNLTKAVLSE